MDYVPSETKRIVAEESARSLADWMLLSAAGFTAIFLIILIVLVIQHVLRNQ